MAYIGGIYRDGEGSRKTAVLDPCMGFGLFLGLLFGTEEEPRA